MSLLNDPNFMAFDGTPVTGRTPVSAKVYGRELSEAQRNEAAGFFSRFKTSVRLSIANHQTRWETFTDGSVMYMASSYGIDSVIIWPTGGSTRTKPLQFFCIPFDESYRTTPNQDTYATESYDPEAPETVLDSLTKQSSYAFIPTITTPEGTATAALSHPGNQTWFANIDPPNDFEKYVVSWWGQPNRYSASPLDTILTSGSGRTDQEYGYSQTINPADNVRTVEPHGWSDAIDGNFYRPRPATQFPAAYPAGQVPPFVQRPIIGSFVPIGEFHRKYNIESTSSTNPIGAASNAAANTDFSTAGATRRAVWINTVRYLTDFDVDSACLAKRGDDQVLRIFTWQRAGALAVIREFDLRAIIAGESVGLIFDAEATKFTAAMPDFSDIAPARLFGQDETRSYDFMAHPFYWNASGTEAMGLFVINVGYERGIPGFSRTGRGSFTALLKLREVAGAFEVSWMETSIVQVTKRFEHTDTSDYWGTGVRFVENSTRAIVEGEAPVDGGGTTAVPSVLRYVGTYVGVSKSTYAIGADYQGDTPIILRGEWEDVVNAVRNDYAESPLVNGSSTGGLTLTSKLYVNNSEIVAPQVCIASAVTAASNTHSQDDASRTGTYTSTVAFSQTGCANLWAISAGDLRGGKLILRASPYTLQTENSPLAYSSWTNGSRTGGRYSTYHYVREGNGGTETLSRTESSGESLTDSVLAGQFLLVDVKSLTSESLGNRVDPADSGGRARTFSCVPFNSVDYVYGLNSPLNTYTTSGDGFCKMTDFRNIPVQGRVTYNTTIVNPKIVGPSPRVYTKNSAYGDNLPEDYSSIGVGGYTCAAFSSGAVSPDGRMQYIGLVSTALAAPNSAAALPPLVIDKWFIDGGEFAPDAPYPYTGAYKMLSCPVFAAPNLDS